MFLFHIKFTKFKFNPYKIFLCCLVSTYLLFITLVPTVKIMTTWQTKIQVHLATWTF